MALPGSGLIRFGRRPAAPDLPAEAEMLSALGTPLLLVDPDGTAMAVNGASETLINLSRAAIVGRNIEAMIGHPLTSFPSDSPFAAYDTEITLPGGRHQRADLMVSPLPERAGWRVVTLHGRAPA
ncbi:MAG: two-component sensor histidine kinase, partial [Sphingomonadales bacterium]